MANIYQPQVESLIQKSYDQAVKLSQPQAVRDVSEIERELNSLHSAIDTLTTVFDDLRGRVEPVSSSAGVCAQTQQGTAPEQPTSSQVASGIQAARSRAQHLTHRMREAIDLLRC